jgi:O-antigen ligase
MAGPITMPAPAPAPREGWSAAGEVAGIVALPGRHHRRIGLRMLQLGMGLLLGCLCLGLATMHIAFALALAGALLARFPLQRLPGFWLAVAFAAWQLASLGLGLAAAGSPYQLPKGLGPAYVWLSLFLAQAAFVELAVRRWAMQLLLLTSACSALLATLQFIVGLGGSSLWKVDPAGERFRLSIGFAPIHLTQGFLMAMVFLVLLDARIISGPLERVQLGFGRSYALWAMVISGARLAIIALPFGLAVRCAAAGTRRALLLATAMLAGALAAGIAALLLLSPGSVSRMAHGEDGRFAIWRVSLAQINEHPWFGLGGGNAFRESYNAAFARVLPHSDNEFKDVGGAPHAHSSLISLAAEYGLPAMLLYLAFMGQALAPAYRARRRHPRAWALAAALAATSVVAGLFENLAGHSASAYATYVLIGLALGCCQSARPADAA